MQRVAVVTGGNKGIGNAVVRLLAQRLPDTVVYLTARNVELGQTALRTIKAQVDASVAERLRFHQLDITDRKSCELLRADLLGEHGGVDILINNAGIAYKQASTASVAEQAKVTNDTNYFGLRNVCDALFPILNKNARVVNVQSQSGLLNSSYSDELKQQLTSASLTIPQLDSIVNEFVTRATDGTLGAGWPTSCYGMSKAAGIALTRIQQREFDAQDRNIIVNAICPGYVNTDMTSHKGPLSVDEGAETPIWAAVIPSDANEPKGQFCYKCKVTPWVK